MICVRTWINFYKYQLVSNRYQQVFRRTKRSLYLTRPDKKNPAPISGYDYYQQRLNFVDKYKADGINLYPHKLQITHSLTDICAQFGYLAADEDDSSSVRVTGRIFSQRESSKKLKFLTILDDGTKLQIVLNYKHYGNQDFFHIDTNRLSRGDIIWVEGNAHRTKSGELSIKASKLTMLAPCLHLLPSPHDKIKNPELLQRARYLDILVNDSSRNRFILRSKTIAFIRKFLSDLNFLEVETPILSSVPGGAAARPFKTHHNSLGLDLSLRVAPELYLKMLIVGGFNKVFEIGRQFRNEGIDACHNPEFTACEFYSINTDYNDLRVLTENLLSTLVFDLFNSYNLIYDTTAAKLNLNFEPPFRTLSFMDSIESTLNVNLPAPEILHTEEARNVLFDICSKKNMNIDDRLPTSKLLDKLFELGVQPMCEQPTFILDHPKIMSPLAKEHSVTKGLTERFELFIAGKEICNAYTELNDPQEQRLRFEREKLKAESDFERQVADEDFCTALEHGLPPTAGWGMGLDRLVMILTNSPSISDVILFPTMKPSNVGKYRIKKSTDDNTD